jgi:isocitrate/isopropylmalate dehydrogenase
MSSNTYRIAALAGDGIGPEVMREALSVLRAVGDKFSLKFDVTEAPVGWAVARRADLLPTHRRPENLDLSLDEPLLAPDASRMRLTPLWGGWHDRLALRKHVKFLDQQRRE